MSNILSSAEILLLTSGGHSRKRVNPEEKGAITLSKEKSPFKGRGGKTG